MKNTTLCYIHNDRGETLLLHRVKKERDVNEGKWVGIGGHFEEKESPEECVVREVWEETGLTLTAYRYRAVITFVSDRWETEQMHLFTGEAVGGELKECDEGILAWVADERVPTLPTWEGDRLFLDLLAADAPFFSMKLVYEGDTLTQATLNGAPLSLEK